MGGALQARAHRGHLKRATVNSSQKRQSWGGGWGARSVGVGVVVVDVGGEGTFMATANSWPLEKPILSIFWYSPPIRSPIRSASALRTLGYPHHHHHHHHHTISMSALRSVLVEMGEVTRRRAGSWAILLDARTLGGMIGALVRPRPHN